MSRNPLRPLSYPSADRMIHLGTSWPGLHPPAEYYISRFMYFRFRQSRSLENIGIYLDNMYALPGGDGLTARGGDRAS